MTATTAPAIESPRIYVACLAAYNNGTLHGEWIELAGKGADDIHDEIQAMLHRSPEHDPEGPYGPAEEWAIHDHDCFGGVYVGEYDSITRLVAIADAIDEHGDVFHAWASEQPQDFDPEAFDIDNYAGAHESETDWAWVEAEDMIERVDKMLGESRVFFKFDADDYVLTAQCDGYNFVRHNGQVHVFRPA